MDAEQLYNEARSDHVWYLRSIEGLGYAAIGVRIGVSLDTARQIFGKEYIRRRSANEPVDNRALRRKRKWV